MVIEKSRCVFMTKAFLIGAGATRAQYSEAPLSADFFEKLREGNRPLFNHINQTLEDHIPNSLIESNVEDIMILSYNFPQSIKTSFLESLFTAIDILISIPTKSNIGNMRQYLNSESRNPPTIFKTLLTDARLNKNDFFMTLNYDLCLDREILNEQGEIDYGLDKGYLSNDSEIPVSDNQNFSVYHFHGSINWENLGGNKLKIYKGAINPKYTKMGSNMYLIPPGKKEIYPLLKGIWDVAENRLLNADELIIIGCSLNPDDNELIDLLIKFIEENGIENIKLIYRSTFKDTSKEDYYESILGRGFKGFPYGFTLNAPDGKQGALEFIFNNSK